MWQHYYLFTRRIKDLRLRLTSKRAPRGPAWHDYYVFEAMFTTLNDKPVDEVAKLYEGERAQLEIGAGLAKFPHIFAIRNVEGILRQRGIEKLAVLAASRPPLAA